MRVRILGNGRTRGIELPLSDARLSWQMKQLWDEDGKLDCTLESAYGDWNPLRRLTGQIVNMDELNFFAKRMDSFTAIKDLINLTYSMKGLFLLIDFSDPVEVGKRLYMDQSGGISAEEGGRVNFIEYGQKVAADGNCKIRSYGVFVENGFEMQEVYNGRTFPEYWYDTERIVAVLEMMSFMLASGTGMPHGR